MVAVVAVVVVVYFARRVRHRGWAVGPRAAAGRGRRQPDRPDAPRARAVPRARRRLPRAAALAGLQRRRHVHRRRRRHLRHPADAWHPARRVASRGARPGTTRDRRRRGAAHTAGARGPGRRAGRRRAWPGCSASRAPGRRPDRRRSWSRSTGARPAKSDRVRAGCGARRRPSRVEADPLEVRAEVVEGIRIIHDDDDIVVIDKPVGVAVHPSPGWTGPTVVGHLRGAGLPDRDQRRPGAAGHRAAARRRYVGRDGDRKCERAYSRAQERLPPPRRSTRPTTRSCRATRTRSRAPSTPRSAGTRSPTASSRCMSRRQAQRHPLRDARGAPVRQPARGAPRDRPHPPDPGAHGRAEAPVRRRPHLRRRPDARQAGRAGAAVAARRRARLRAPRDRGATSSTSRRTPTTWPTPSRSSVMPTDPTAADLRPAAGDRATTWRRCSPCSPPRRGRRAAAGVPEPPARGPGLGRGPAGDAGRRSGWPTRGRHRAGLRSACAASWLALLFVDPERPGRGVGAALLDLVKGLRPHGFGLWVFEANDPRARLLPAPRPGRARAHRRQRLTRTMPPDVQMAWLGRPTRWPTCAAGSTRSTTSSATCWPAARPSPPPSRTTRRSAATPAATPSARPRSSSGWPRRAPGLGRERLARIVHAIIAESLDAALGATDEP